MDSLNVASLPVVSRAELAKHAREGDGWIVINDLVFDLSKFYGLHPGELAAVEGVGGGPSARGIAVHASRDSRCVGSIRLFS